MLGELIFESNGKIISQRVISVENGVPKLEITAAGSGTVRGNIGANETWTYWTIQRSDGTFHGEGQGIITAKEGSEFITATGRGEGSMTKTGTSRYPGALFFNTASGNKLAFLNHIIGVNEYEVDELGGYSFKCWEWK
jgi:hypothetical protein